MKKATLTEIREAAKDLENKLNSRGRYAEVIVEAVDVTSLASPKPEYLFEVHVDFEHDDS